MKAARDGWRVGAAALVATLAWVAGPAEAGAQEQEVASSGRAKVLVAPLRTAEPVKDDFGRKVADEVRKSLEDFPTLTPVEGDQLREELKKLKLDEKELGPIQWRQLASRLGAQVVMYGTVESGSGGNRVRVVFVDARTGDELPVPEFSVAGDRGEHVKEAAGRIYEAFEDQVEFRKAVVFCRDYLAAEQHEDAIRNCNRALELNPRSAEALYLRGRIHMAREEWEAAQTDLEKVVEDNPAKTDALQSLAYTLAQLGDTERATKLYREYLNFNPGDADVRLKVAYDLATAGAFDPAIALLQDGVALDSTNAALWEYLGNVALSKGTRALDVDAVAGGDGGSAASAGAEATISDTGAVRLAIRAYDHVLTLRGDSVDPNILKNVIAAHLNMQEYTQAEAFWNRAKERAPQDAGLWSIGADLFGRMDRFPDAIAALDRVAELNPDYSNLYIRRGLFKLRAGDRDGAMADLRRAIERGTDPNVVAGQLLARAYKDNFEKGQYEAAIAMFRLALEFAKKQELTHQLNFFTAYGYYQQGAAIDKSNEAAEACEPARRALDRFRQVLPHLDRAGDYQARSQAQIRESVDVYLFRQEAIIKKACRG